MRMKGKRASWAGDACRAAGVAGAILLPGLQIETSAKGRRLPMETDGRRISSQTEMEPDDGTVICAGVFRRKAFLMRRRGAVDEGGEALFQRNEKSPQRVTLKTFPTHGITSRSRIACSFKVEFRNEIFLRPVLRLGLCSGCENQGHHRKGYTESAYADTAFHHNVCAFFPYSSVW